MKIWQLLIICGGLMFIGINQSLWLDEAISANVVKKENLVGIIKNYSIKDFHPPLYYLTLKLWTEVSGYSEVGIRSLSILFALVTIYVVYKMAGINAAMLTGFNPLLIYYAQEARMYAMATMLLTLVLYFFKQKRYLWVNIFGFLSFATFYGSIFFLAALGTYLLINKKYKELIISNIGILVALIILSPLLRLQFQNSGEMLSTVKNWSLVLGKANLKNLLLIPMKFTSGRISFYPKVFYYLLSGGFATLVFCKLIKTTFESYIFWITLAIGVVFSIFTPMLQYFRFLYLIPVMAIVLKKDKLVMVGFLIFSLFYLTNQNMWREDWKSLSKKLNSNVYMIASFADPVKYYSNTKIVDIRDKVIGTEIQVIPYGEEIHGVNHNEILERLGYKKIRAESFRGITLESWHLGT